MAAVQITDVEFDFTDGFGELEAEEQQKVIDAEIGSIYEIDGHPDQLTPEEFDYLVCEEITSETGWMVRWFDYILIQTEWV